MKTFLWKYILLICAGLLIVLLPSTAFPADLSAQDSTGQDSTALKAYSRDASENEEMNYHYETPLHGLEIRSRGNIEFNDTFDGIKSMSPNGYLLISERRWFTTRQLEVTGDAEGNPSYRFSIRGRNMEFDERAKEWMRYVMPDVIRLSGFNAAARVEQLLSEGGVNAVLREIPRLENNSVKRIYILKLVELGNLNENDWQNLIRLSGEEISSSSQLNRTLCELAEKAPADPRLTAELFMAAENISSSSEKREAISRVARVGSMDTDAGIAMGRSIKTINSSSETASALEVMAETCPADDPVVAAYLDAAESINSSSERARAIIALSEQEGMSSRSWVGMAHTAGSISSSSETRRTLEAIARKCPPDDEVMSAYLHAAASINSSSESANAIVAALEKENLSEATYIEIARAAATISSSSEQGRVLRKMAVVCPPDDGVVNAYIDSAFDIPSSSEKEEALVAILQRDGLSQSVLADILKRANSEISSSSSRQTIVDMVSQRLNVN